MIEYNIKINMQGERELCEDILFTSGDKNGYRLNLAFYSNGKLYDASSCALTVKSKRADGAVIIDSGVCTAEGVYYDVADNAIAVEGELPMEIALVRANGEYVTTAVILTRVRKGFGETGLLSSDNEPVLAKLEAQALVTQAKANSVADDLVGHNADSEAHPELFKKERGAFANVLKGEADGDVVTLDDVSPVVHDISLEISSKNKIPFPYKDKTKTENGLTFTVNNDGSITLNGTPTGTAMFVLYEAYGAQKVLEKDKTYTFSLKGTPDIWYCFMGNNVRNASDSSWQAAIGSTEGKNKSTATVKEDYTGFQLYIVVTKKVGTLDNLTIYPYITEGIDSGEFIPYVPNVEEVKVRVSDESGEVVCEYTPDTDGHLYIPSISSLMAISTDTEGVKINAKYNKDTNKVIEKLTNAIIAMGGNI